MIVLKHIKLLEINLDPFFKETELQNPDGLPITIPARSVLWTDQDDLNGFPIYESASLDYVRPQEVSDGYYDLVSTPLLDERNAAKESKKTPPSEIQSRVFHIVLFHRDKVTGEAFQYDFDEEKIIEKLTSSRVNYQFGIATHSCDIYTDKEVQKEIKDLTARYRSTGQTDEGGLEDYLRLHRKIFKGNQKPIHTHAVIRNEKTDAKGGHVNMRLASLAKRLGIPESCIQQKFDNSARGGTDGFIDAIRYLTHDTVEAAEDGKYQYPDDIRTVNFD